MNGNYLNFSLIFLISNQKYYSYFQFTECPVEENIEFSSDKVQVSISKFKSYGFTSFFVIDLFFQSCRNPVPLGVDVGDCADPDAAVLLGPRVLDAV